MDLNRARALIGDMQSLSTGYASRVKPGVFYALFQKLEEDTIRSTKAPMLRATATVITTLKDEFGRVPNEEGFDGHYKGEEVSWIYRFNDYFVKEFSPFLMAGLGLTDAEAKGLTQDEIISTFADIARDAGSEKPGLFDGSVVFEITATRSAPKKNDKKSEEAGKEVLDTFVNIRNYRKIPLAEVAEKLEEADIDQYFGSLENFAALMDAEA